LGFGNKKIPFLKLANWKVLFESEQKADFFESYVSVLKYRYIWDLKLRVDKLLLELYITNLVHSVQNQTNIFPKKKFIIHVSV
jgi:hypothetical protein